MVVAGVAERVVQDAIHGVSGVGVRRAVGLGQQAVGGDLVATRQTLGQGGPELDGPSDGLGVVVEMRRAAVGVVPARGLLQVDDGPQTMPGAGVQQGVEPGQRALVPHQRRGHVLRVRPAHQRAVADGDAHQIEALPGEPRQIRVRHPGRLEGVQQRVATVVAEPGGQQTPERQVRVVVDARARRRLGQERVGVCGPEARRQRLAQRRVPGLVVTGTGLAQRFDHGVPLSARLGGHDQAPALRVVDGGDPRLVEEEPAQVDPAQVHGLSLRVDQASTLGVQAGEARGGRWGDAGVGARIRLRGRRVGLRRPGVELRGTGVHGGVGRRRTRVLGWTRRSLTACREGQSESNPECCASCRHGGQCAGSLRRSQSTRSGARPHSS